MSKVDLVYQALEKKDWFKDLGMDEQGELVLKVEKKLKILRVMEFRNTAPQHFATEAVYQAKQFLKENK